MAGKLTSTVDELSRTRVRNLVEGRYDIWKNCGPDQNGRVFVLAALPGDQSYLTVVQVVAASEADLEAQKHVLDTFKVSGAV